MPPVSSANKENAHPLKRPLVPKPAANTFSNALGKPDPVTHPERCTFYFDLSDGNAVQKLTRYTVMIGAQCSAFFDKNVTHLVTDKARGISSNYSRACKWGFDIWHLEKFADMIIGYLERTQVNSRKVELSPTLQKAASATKKRDLQHYLEEEKRKMRKHPITTTLSNSLKDDTGHEVRVFEHPVVMIEDSEYRYAAVYKEYEGSGGQIKYPIFYWNSAPGHSPFILPHTPAFPINRPLPPPPPPLADKENNNNPAAGTRMTTRSKSVRKTNTPVFRRPTYTATTNKARPGFCECCWDKFSDLEHHTHSSKHRTYARNPEHYQILDQLLSNHPRTFCTLTTSTGSNNNNKTNVPISPAKSLAKTEDDKCRASRGYTETKRRKQVEAARAMFDKAPSLADVLSSPSVKRQRKGQSGNAEPIKRRLFV